MKIRLATRGSPLALVQAKMAERFLSERLPDAEFEIVEVKTFGDKDRTASLSANGGTGLFTKEIEQSLLRGDADIAVHSAKDLPTNLAEGLCVCGCLPRDALRDVLAVRAGVEVPSVIASSSPRRRSQLKPMFPNAVWTELRGNVHTRLEKIASGFADATILSEAGLLRLGISSFDGLVLRPLKPDVCVPAVGQGIVALECRIADVEKFRVTDSAAEEAFSLERAFLRALGGGCQSAFAANFDGARFRFFHENTGIQNVDLAEFAAFAEKLEVVQSLASGIVGR